MKFYYLNKFILFVSFMILPSERLPLLVYRFLEFYKFDNELASTPERRVN